MTQPKPLHQVFAETKATVRDLVAETAELRKHPSIAGLPSNAFAGFDSALQRLENQLRSLDDVSEVTGSENPPPVDDPEDA